MLTSCVCRFADFLTPWYAAWSCGDAPVRYHRKNWEFAAITQALLERYAIGHGKRGIGFAVGSEPLASRFAAFGSHVLATDLEQSDASSAWAESGQHAASKQALFRPEFVNHVDFAERVTFRPMNMLRSREFPDEQFDFVWSACAFEHLGSIDAGLRFVQESARLLKPGGVAVHTTEYNVSSNDRTIDRGATVLFRQRDVERLETELALGGYTMAPFDPSPGNHAFDTAPDEPPYYQSGHQHVKLRIGDFVSTSALVIVEARG
jgi:SAM-dependent methyltransferase